MRQSSPPIYQPNPDEERRIAALRERLTPPLDDLMQWCERQGYKSSLRQLQHVRSLLSLAPGDPIPPRPPFDQDPELEALARRMLLKRLEPPQRALRAPLIDHSPARETPAPRPLVAKAQTINSLQSSRGGPGAFIKQCRCHS
jgi:hypothetical protein